MLAAAALAVRVVAALVSEYHGRCHRSMQLLVTVTVDPRWSRSADRSLSVGVQAVTRPVDGINSVPGREAGR